MARRRWRGSIDVSVDVDDVIESLDDETVRELYVETFGEPLDLAVLDRIRWHLLRGEAQAAIAIIEGEATQRAVADAARATQYAELRAA